MPELNPLSNEQILLKKIAENTGSSYNTGDVSEINPLTIDQILLKEIAANTAGIVTEVDDLKPQLSDPSEVLVLAPTSEGKALIHTAYGMSIQNGTPTPSVPVDIESAKANFISMDGENTQNVTTNLTLRAIEVSSTDNYNLVRDNKYYIADTLDYSEDNGFVVTRRIGRTSLTSSMNWAYNDINKLFNIAYSTENIPINTSYATRIKTKSNRFIFATSASDTTWGYCNSYTLYFNLFDSGETMSGDIATLKTWLDNNPTYIDYILATPTTENITTEQALALLSLKTYDESTSISSQAEPSCTVAIEYAKERLAAVALIAHNLAKGNDLRIAELEETP